MRAPFPCPPDGGTVKVGSKVRVTDPYDENGRRSEKEPSASVIDSGAAGCGPRLIERRMS